MIKKRKIVKEVRLNSKKLKMKKWLSTFNVVNLFLNHWFFASLIISLLPATTKLIVIKGTPNSG